jgi:hypothetical protein
MCSSLKLGIQRVRDGPELSNRIPLVLTQTVLEVVAGWPEQDQVLLSCDGFCKASEPKLVPGSSSFTVKLSLD